MSHNSDFQRDFIYPLFWIELPERKEFSTMDVVYRRSGFTTLFRLPSKAKFSTGLLFDAGGRCFCYDGERGPCRLKTTSIIKVILESLVLPSLLFWPLSSVVYYGPNIQSCEELSLGDFKQKIMQAILSHKSNKDADREIDLPPCQDFRAVIEAIEHWRYFGGKRDEDGHLLGRADCGA
ncbi:hypothetical protein [Celeribacter neptunius]|uniref:hypothetical protein n=1 Tax=Celeribacter neptunius TaxID=588602 RepID=UPI000B7EB913|nr:hypothetical protein [Celeribacter neptunius]